MAGVASDHRQIQFEQPNPTPDQSLALHPPTICIDRASPPLLLCVGESPLGLLTSVAPIRWAATLFNTR